MVFGVPFVFEFFEVSARGSLRHLRATVRTYDRLLFCLFPAVTTKDKFSGGIGGRSRPGCHCSK